MPPGGKPWSDPSAWPGGAIPGPGTDATIPAGSTVVLDVATPPLGDLTVDGTLVFSDDRDVALTAASILVMGRLQAGSETQPYQHRAVVTLTGADPTRDIMGMGAKVLGVISGALELHGARRDAVSWTRLAATAGPGSREITLAEAPRWLPGDRVVLASSSFDPAEAEEVGVTAVTGAVVTLDAPLRHQHRGTVQDIGGHRLDERAEVGLLTRNIVIQGDEASEGAGFGGHVMVVGGGTAQVEGVELTRVGQEGIAGRYPLHWHENGDSPGQYARNNSIHHSYSRLLTLHRTDRVLVAGNVGYDSFGHGYFIEDGVEVDNILDGNLGLLTKAARKPLLPSDGSPATFWTTSSDNVLRNNAAAGSEGSGFWYQAPERPTGRTTDAEVSPRDLPLGEFSGNTAHSNGNGGQSGETSGNGLNLEHTTPGPVVGFTAYKNWDAGIWADGATVTGATLADNKTGVFSRGGVMAVADSLIAGVTASGDGTFPTKEFQHGDQPIVAVQNYDGSVRTDGVTFAGYRNIETGTRRLSGVIGFSDSKGDGGYGSSFIRSTLVDANPVGFTPAFEYTPSEPAEPKRTLMFEDLDGTLTGVGGPSTIVYNNPLQVTAGCTPLFERASACPGLGYAGVTFNGFQGKRLDLTRADGVTGQITSYVAPNGGDVAHHNVPGGTSYSLDTGGAQPSQVYVGINAQRVGTVVRVEMPYDPDTVFVYDDKNTAVPMVGSVTELAAAQEPFTAYLDAGRNVVHLQLRSSDAGERRDGGYSDRLHYCQRDGCSP